MSVSLESPSRTALAPLDSARSARGHPGAGRGQRVAGHGA